MNEINAQSSLADVLSYMNKFRESERLTQEQSDQIWLAMTGLLMAYSVKNAEDPAELLKNLPEVPDFRLMLLAAERVSKTVQL